MSEVQKDSATRESNREITQNQMLRAENQTLRDERDRLSAALLNVRVAWNNKNETTNLHVWHERMKAAMADVEAALTPAGQRWTRERCPITFTCPHCRGKGCEPCKQLGWFFVPWPYPGGQINNACS